MIVEPAHLAYLGLQRGRLSNLLTEPEKWRAAYEAGLKRDLQELTPHLPRRFEAGQMVVKRSILDIGAGLGGIDALLAQIYGEGTEVVIMDGMEDPPVMKLHRETYSCARIARDFLAKNGAKNVAFIDPRRLPIPRGFDLIMSFGSWCFHYPPSYYLEFVAECFRRSPSPILIVDCRRGKTSWRAELDERFKYVATIRDDKKFSRLVYHARGR